MQCCTQLHVSLIHSFSELTSQSIIARCYYDLMFPEHGQYFFCFQWLWCFVCFALGCPHGRNKGIVARCSVNVIKGPSVVWNSNTVQFIDYFLAEFWTWWPYYCVLSQFSAISSVLNIFYCHTNIVLLLYSTCI